MNRIYRSIWNERSNTFVAAPESARGRGKRSSPGAGPGARSALLPLNALPLCLMLALGTDVYALPTGAAVSAGSANIAGSAAKLTINQSSQSVAINWQSFNIGQSEAVQFVQPNSNSVALNRVPVAVVVVQPPAASALTPAGDAVNPFPLIQNSAGATPGTLRDLNLNVIGTGVRMPAIQLASLLPIRLLPPVGPTATAAVGLAPVEILAVTPPDTVLVEALPAAFAPEAPPTTELPLQRPRKQDRN